MMGRWVGFTIESNFPTSGSWFTSVRENDGSQISGGRVVKEIQTYYGS